VEEAEVVPEEAEVGVEAEVEAEVVAVPPQPELFSAPF
jgi:hypothetical protein